MTYCPSRVRARLTFCVYFFPILSALYLGVDYNQIIHA
jgi:hypothetical protein